MYVDIYNHKFYFFCFQIFSHCQSDVVTRICCEKKVDLLKVRNERKSCLLLQGGRLTDRMALCFLISAVALV